MTTLTSRRRCLRDLACLGGLGALGGCATIIYPERRGNRSGPIDVGPLVLDILWFIPGIIPGIIALAVDFTTGAIYLGGRRRAALDPTPLAIPPGERLVVRAPRPDERVEVALRLVGGQGTVLDETEGHWGMHHGDDLHVTLAPDQGHALGEGRLELVMRHRGVGATTSYPLAVRTSTV